MSNSETARNIDQPEAKGSLDAADVAEFLINNPEFFEANPKVLDAALDRLEISHSAGPKATSLIERQVAVLREKNQKLEKQFVSLVEVAKENEGLVAKIDALAIGLLGCRSRTEVVSLLEETLRKQLGAETAVMVLFLPSVEGREPETRFLRVIDPKDPALTPFKTFIDAGEPRCGYIRDTQRDFLFGENNIEIGSAALVPLGDECSTGFLAIGSSNAEYFSPDQSMDFLLRLGQLIAAALSVR